MSAEMSFQELLEQARAGDQDAMTALVRTYEPHVRRFVRVRLYNAEHRRAVDSEDICQSVMKSLLKPAALMRYRLETPEDLLKLLSRMARNKVIDWIRKNRPDRPPPPSPQPPPSPSKVLSDKELTQLARQHLTAEELAVWDLQEQGLTWEAIAKQVGGNGESGESVRKKQERAFRRIREIMLAAARPSTQRKPSLPNREAT